MQLPSTIVDSLHRLQLTDKQIRIIEALFVTPRAKVYDISLRLKGVTRTEIYTLIDSLVKERLVKKVHVNNVVHCALVCKEEILLWARNKYELMYSQMQDCSCAVTSLTKYLRESTFEKNGINESIHFEGEKGLISAHELLGDLYPKCKVRALVNLTSEGDQFSSEVLDLVKSYFGSGSELVLITDCDRMARDAVENMCCKHLTKINLALRAPELSDLLLVYMADKWMVSFYRYDGELHGTLFRRDGGMVDKIFTKNYDRLWEQC